MAEIKIEKERTIWPWVLLGVLLLGLLLYFLVFRNDNKAEDIAQSMQNTANQTTTQDNNQGAVAGYISFVNGSQAMGLDHEFSNGALIRLANAVQAKADQAGYNVQADLDQVKELANEITQDPMATTHANSIRRAAGILSTTMQNMQQAKFPNLNNEAEEVRRAAQGIDPEVLTLEQKEAVKSFFDKSAQLLQRMD
jgi:hypothetical protein